MKPQIALKTCLTWAKLVCEIYDANCKSLGCYLNPVLGGCMFEEVAGKAEASLQITGQLWLLSSCCQGPANAPCTRVIPADLVYSK